jgi:hypothetical protein
MIEKIKVSLSDVRDPYHNWEGVTWGRVNSNQAMAEVSLRNVAGNPIEVWVEGTINGEQTAVRLEDVSRLYVTIQGSMEHEDMAEFFNMFAASMRLSDKMHLHEE